MNMLLQKGVTMVLNILGLLIFLPAKADYLDYKFFVNPEISVLRDDRQDIPLQAVCADMKYNYLEESERLKSLKAQMDWAVQQPLTDDQVIQISKIKTALRETAARLIHLSNPDWSAEVMNYWVVWRLPDEYDSTEKNFVKAEVSDIYYKGSFAGHLAPQIELYGVFPALSEPPRIPGLPPVKRYVRYVKFFSRGTYFDLCQFIPTLQIEMKVNYYLMFFKGKLHEEMFFLKGRKP